MTIIEAMKLRKRLAEKAVDLRGKIGQNCAIMDGQSPMYPDQKTKVEGWLQSHRDIVQLMGRLSVAIQKTNLLTPVTIVLGNKEVTKSIAEWVVRRRELAPMDLAAWGQLGDRGLKEQALQDRQTNEIKIIKVIRFFDPSKRDEMKDLFSSEPSRIDAKLETVNALTQLADDIEVNEDALIN